MYLKIGGLYQKMIFAVDDKVPVTDDGKNLFTQLESSDSNIVLTILEKCKFSFTKAGSNIIGYKIFLLQKKDTWVSFPSPF